MYRLIPTIILFTLVAGCASMTSTKEELQSISANEGVVVGSVLLTVEKAKENVTGWKLHNFETEDYDWLVEMRKEPFEPFTTIYSLTVKPGKEEIFVKKLPAGTYRINNIEPTFGLLTPNLSLYLGVHFTVKPGQTTYIGRLATQFPYRIKSGSKARIDIQDNAEETIDKLRIEYPSTFENIIKDLAVRIPLW